MSVYVYKHINPIDGKAFYVGKGTGKRAFDQRDGNKEWKAFVANLKKQGLTFGVVIHKICKNSHDALVEEGIAIREEVAKGSVLTNCRKKSGDNLNGTAHGKEAWDSDDPLALFVVSRRKALKWSQSTLAKKAGIGMRFIRDLEWGRPNSRLRNINKVLAVFGHKLTPVPIDAI